MRKDRRWTRVSMLCIALAAGCLLAGCSETLEPGDGCVGWYQGFYILSSPESVYVRVELDFTWALPDSALILTPRRTLRASRIFEHGDPLGLAIVAGADDHVIGGWYLLRAFYGDTERTYEEHVAVRSDFLDYDYGTIEPQRGEVGVVLDPTVRWGALPRTEARVSVYADSLREHWIYESGPLEGSDSLRVPAGVLEEGIRYYWTLEIYDWETFVPECPAGYYYMDFFDNGILYVGWFTTANTTRLMAGGRHDR